jgi:urea carboxylase
VKFEKVLIANRGAIACRILRTLRRMGIGSVAVYSEADRYSLHVAQADESVCIGPAPAAQSYLDAARILAAARETGAQAIHPGYGFLAENAEFAEACGRAGVRFIGPTPAQIRAFGLKHAARELAERAGVPLVPGSALLADPAHAAVEAQRIGYPVMIKSTAGGGGIGLQRCRSPADLPAAYERVERLARNNFKNAGIFLERTIERGRHLEVQIFGDGRGRVVSLGERDCSAQRRNQKVVEESPAPGLPAALRARLAEVAVRLGRTVQYSNAGTVEFIYDVDARDFYFLEVNTRLQVEHGVTEQVTGIDLVEWMVRQAAGDSLPLDEAIRPREGHAIQVRIYAEDPNREFRPSSGRLTHVRFPADARVETWVEDGTDVSPFYDPMLAKVIVTGADRPDAVAKLRAALSQTRIAGIETNLHYLMDLVATPVFAAGEVTTRTLETLVHRPATMEVLTAGTQTTVQDYPGRIGYWAVGVPPSGPMDSRSFRLANRAVGNAEDAAALETTMAGPTLKFHTEALICLAGAATSATLDGTPVPFWQPTAVLAGQVLAVGNVQDAGCRAYLAVRGGIDAPLYLGSRSTFTLGNFGGHAGRALVSGDVLHIGAEPPNSLPRDVPPALVHPLSHDWEIGVLYGPHGAPDFFTVEDIEAFFSATWEVHYNSSRTGIRLIGPKPRWARADGGEAGLHPSNIHDNAYAIGSIDYTGDMPVILAVDGPSLGGFVCPAVIARAELWKMGQLRPGDRIRFRPLSLEQAADLDRRAEAEIAEWRAQPPLRSAPAVWVQDASPVVGTLPAQADRPEVVYRIAGDKNLLVEYGPPNLDLALRLRVHALMEALQRDAARGIIDLTPGIRSLQIHFDSTVLPIDRLLEILRRQEALLPATTDLEIPTRIVRLPLSWDDEATQLAIRKYTQSVRADAPWCPSNIEFIRRINGLDSVAEVKRIVFGARFLVLGLGDVYLGAPVATPIDPRHRLVTTKYNPARTWTPENAVGIGGAYLCVYGMEGPGGYQFVGRTCQMWNTYHVTALFEPGKPWLLRFFDQIRFYEVSAAELLQFRADFLHGRVSLEVQHDTFRMRDYRRFLEQNAASIGAFKARQQAAFDAERSRWADRDAAASEIEPAPSPADAPEPVPTGGHAVSSPVPGCVWKISAQQGQPVQAGDPILVVESMKMEIPVLAPVSGIVAEIRCAEGRMVSVGQTLAVLMGDLPGGI